MAASQYRVRPSSMGRMLACPGSLQMEEKFPQTDETEAAAEGTAAHEAFAMLMEGLEYSVGHVASNAIVITAEMIEAAATTAAIVRAWATPYTYIERQMPCPSVHPLCGGMPDAWGWDAQGSTIRVLDLKFGHRYVDVVDNEQLCAYTCGIIDEMKIDGLAEINIFVEWTIVQPRAFHRDGPIKTIRFPLAELSGLRNRLASAAAEAVSASPRCQPSEQCRDCNGRHACVALQRASASVVQFVHGTIEDFVLAPDQVGRELSRLEHAATLLDSRIEGLREQGVADIRAGKRVTGYELTQSYGREIWKPEHAANVVAMGQMTGHNLLKEREPITPAQARKLGFDPDALELTMKPAGSMKLAKINTNQTRKIFGA